MALTGVASISGGKGGTDVSVSEWEFDGDEATTFGETLSDPSLWKGSPKGNEEEEEEDDDEDDLDEDDLDEDDEDDEDDDED